jgi:predicted RNA binding protein YcfA (HicA-like mRNA interferase family)
VSNGVEHARAIALALISCFPGTPERIEVRVFCVVAGKNRPHPRPSPGVPGEEGRAEVMCLLRRFKTCRPDSTLRIAYAIFECLMPSDVRFAVVRKMLEAKGYALVRVQGSHYVFSKAGIPRPVVISVHGGKVKHGYVRDIQKLA